MESPPRRAACRTLPMKLNEPGAQHVPSLDPLLDLIRGNGQGTAATISGVEAVKWGPCGVIGTVRDPLVDYLQHSPDTALLSDQPKHAVVVTMPRSTIESCAAKLGIPSEALRLLASGARPACNDRFELEPACCRQTSGWWPTSRVPCWR